MSVFRKKTSSVLKPHSHANNQPLIDIDSLSVKLAGAKVVQNVSFDIHEGEFIGLIGTNGSGKSSLLRAMLGLIPSTGRVTQHVTGSIGYVQQRGTIQNQQTPISVQEVVELGSKGSRQAAHEALQVVDMHRFASRAFSQLSGGQQQKVYIAKALASNPCLLILDEPTTGIDEQSQVEFYALLQNLQSQGIAILMVSHSIDTVLRLVKRVICLNRTILYDGPPAHFVADKYMPKYYTQRHRTIHHYQHEPLNGAKELFHD